MTETDYLKKLNSNEPVLFEDLIKIIETNYHYTPTEFNNGNLTNSQTENQGSAKLLSFAKIHHLNKEQTLKCFGQYYLEVLNTPNETNHSNIRNFMKTAWKGVSFQTDSCLIEIV